MLQLKNKIALISSQCVACGCCEAVCPFHAIKVLDGILAQLDSSKCFGCGKCKTVCPASVITMITREVIL